MPVLKDLVCHVQWPESGSPFPEYGTQYGDGIVETYIAIPSHPQTFQIRLTSRKFIFEGLAMLVFIDGEYQCNRNRTNLQPPKPDAARHHTEIDFLVRQKEKPLGEGSYLGREWRFDSYNLGRSCETRRPSHSLTDSQTVSQPPADIDQKHFKDLGTIEILVLRCRRNDSGQNPLSSTSSGEDSGILGRVEEDLEQQDSPAPTDSQDQPVLAKGEETAAEPEGLFGGLFGLFDGPADERPPYTGIPADAPHDSQQYRDWQTPTGRSAPYGPQEDPNAHTYRSGPVRYVDQRRPYPYHNSPPSPAYGHLGSVPPRPERRVHFEYGDRRDPQHGSFHMRREHRYQNDWGGDDRYGHQQPGHSYHDSTHHREFNPYADYSTSPFTGHYMYDADRKTYGRYPESSHPSANHRQFSPPGRPSIPQGYAPPAAQANHPHAFPSMGTIPAIHPQPPAQVTAMPPSQPLPVQVPYPYHVWVPSAAMPGPTPYSAPAPVYPPPHNFPLFHTQGHGFFPGNVIPSGVRTGSGEVPPPQTTSAPEQKGGVSPSNREKTESNNAQGADAQDPAKEASNNAGGEGQANDNAADAWKPGPAAGGSGGGGGQNDASENATAWADGGNANDHNTGNNDNKDPSWTDDNNISNEAWANNTGAQVADDRGWDLNDQSNTSPNRGAGWEKNNVANNQANTWENDKGTNSNNTQTPAPESEAAADQSTVRPLYGPHGAYYTSKAFTNNVLQPDAEEEPRYDVPQSVAQATGVTRQVQPGKGYIYYKKRCVPNYIDTLEEPYAKFVFKYRTKEHLKKQIGVDIVSEPTENEDINALENLEKAELIEMLIRAKGALGGTIPSGPPKRTTPVSAPGFEGVAVDAPDLGFLAYQLPPVRNVSFDGGLGIRIPDRSKDQNKSSNGGDSNQNHDWSTDPNTEWSKSGNNQAPGNWGQENGASNNAGGYDGQQERKKPSKRRPSTEETSKRHPDSAFQPPRRRSSKLYQSTAKEHDVQRDSRRRSPTVPAKEAAREKPSTSFTPDANHDYTGGRQSKRTSDDKVAPNDPFAASPAPQPPPSFKHPSISFGEEGYVGGGRTHYGITVPPRPPTPVYVVPPRPPTPPVGQAGFSNSAKQEKEPWNDLTGEYDPNSGWQYH